MEELLKKYWEGTSTEEEKKRLLQLLEKREVRHFQKLKSEFELNAYSSSNSSKEEKFKIILKELHQKISEQKKKEKIRKHRFLYKIAAAVLVIFTIGFVALQNSNSNLPEISETQLNVIENPHQDKMMFFEMEDGSKVKLFPNSKINYDLGYGNQNRNVKLIGKGYFKVAKNPELPFVVESKDYYTTALGTAFTVDGRSDTIQIQLIEGKIVVNSSDKSKSRFSAIYLSPGEKLIIDEISDRQRHFQPQKSAKVQSTDETSAMEIEKGVEILKFKKENLSEVLRQLSKIYKKKITYNADELEGLTFTGDLYIQDELNHSIQTLCELNELKFTEKANEILIEK